jgi:hypothetical protein
MRSYSAIAKSAMDYLRLFQGRTGTRLRQRISAVPVSTRFTFTRRWQPFRNSLNHGNWRAAVLVN